MFMPRESLCVWYPYAADASRLTVPVDVLSETAGPHATAHKPRQAGPTGIAGFGVVGRDAEGVMRLRGLQ